MKKIPKEAKKEEEREPIEEQLNIFINSHPIVDKVLMVGLIIIVAFFGTFGLWALISPLESASIATGKIVVAGNRKTIQHLEGGIIAAIYVKDGTKVKKGDVLLKIDNTQTAARLQVAQNKVFELMAIEARLLAEIDEKENITFPEKLLENKAQPQVAQFINSQESLFNASRQNIISQTNILNQRIAQLEDQIRGVSAQLKSTEEQLVLIENELKDVMILEKKQLVERSRVLALQREKAQLLGSQGEYVASIANFKQKIGETKLEMVALMDRNRKDLYDQLRETREKLNDAGEQLKSVEDIYKRTDVVSPISGTVVGLRFYTIGGVIKPGEVLMDIVPSQEELIVEAKISTVDIDVVHAGLTAKVIITAFKARTTPRLLGTVSYVSADALYDEASKSFYYMARIVISKNELKRLHGQELYPGMPVEVMIITNRLTPWEYFISPIKQSFRRAFKES